MYGASPYSSRLGLPQSSVRSNGGFHGAIEEDEEDLDDDDEMNNQRDSYDARNKVLGGNPTRGISADREPGKSSQDVADMEWEANDMEL